MSPKKLRLPGGAGRVFSVRRRPARIPPFWRMVDAGPEAESSPLPERQWALVLESRNIPYAVFANGGRQFFYVPPLYERLAREELRAYSAEARNIPAPPPPPPLRGGAAFSLLFFIPLALWQCHACGWDLLSMTPEPLYVRAGALDVARVRIWHEWYRALTALTLHSDAGHLLGNVAFGSFFMFFLCRRAGFAPALGLTLLGGFCGNILNVFLRSGYVVSMGYSTALFASIGALSGIMAFEAARRERRKAVLPLAAGGALLAMLGTGGERTDYLAHISGLGAGFFLGLLAQFSGRLDAAGKGARAALLAICAAAPVGCWILALNKI